MDDKKKFFLKDRVSRKFSCETEEDFHRNFQGLSVRFVKKMAVAEGTLTK
jgi:hypothetical protein